MTADFVIFGPQQLRGAFRKKLMDAISVEMPEATAAASQSTDAVTIAFASPQGIPFPVIIAQSVRYPDCVIAIRWRKGTSGGETTIQNGKVQEVSATSEAERPPHHVQWSQDGQLTLALALTSDSNGVLGYAANSQSETWLRIDGNPPAASLITLGDNEDAWAEIWRDGDCIRLEPPRKLSDQESRVLRSLTEAFRAEWLWFAHSPEVDIAIERHRFEQEQREIHPINVKSRQLGSHATGQLSGLPAEQEWVRELLLQNWGKPETP